MGIGVSTIAQQTQGEFEAFGNETETYVFESSVDYLEITTLFKALSEGGSYFEVGPVFMLNQSEDEKIIELPNGMVANGAPLEQGYLALFKL